MVVLGLYGFDQTGCLYQGPRDIYRSNMLKPSSFPVHDRN
jgi:hypothetical protein